MNQITTNKIKNSVIIYHNMFNGIMSFHKVVMVVIIYVFCSLYPWDMIPIIVAIVKPIPL